MNKKFAVTHGDDEADQFRHRMAKDMHEIADRLEKNNDFVAVALVYCDAKGDGGPMVLVNSNYATVELIDEMCHDTKAALFEGIA